MDNGVELYNQNYIFNHVVEFYKQLFRSTKPNVANMNAYIAYIKTQTIDSNLAEE